MKRVTAGALAVAMVLLGSWVLGEQESAQAQGTVNFDIDPKITGNDADTLGTVEDCYEVTCPSANCTWNGSSSFDNVSDYQVDIVVSGDTQAPTTYYASLNFDPNKVHIAAPGTDDVIKLPGAYSLSGTLPNSVSPYLAGAWYFAGAGTEGDGTLVRVGLDIGASGVVTFSLDSAPETEYTSGADSHHPITVDSGRLAINEYCGIPPVGGIAELPAVSGLAGRNCIGLAGLVAAAALAAGGWYASKRWSR
jgi:hypothetical protein